MDAKRRQEIYEQLRLIFMELLLDREQKTLSPPKSDDSVLRIHVSDMVGAKEQMLH